MIKRSKCENKGIVPTEMELVLEYTQQGASHEVSDHLKMEMEMEIPRDIFKIVSTVVHSGTFGESSVVGITGIVTVVSLYGPSRMHFLKALPFGLVSMYLKKCDCH
ncbi:hypothetical protein Tco_0546766 [Tanacetum coccineum]